MGIHDRAVRSRCLSWGDMDSATWENPAWTGDLRRRLDDLVDEYRTALAASLDGLTEAQSRRRLVTSKTTLLGLLKHVTYVEGVWFDQAVTGRSYAEIGIASTPDRSFTLTKSDTIASVRTAHQQRCEESRRTMAELSLEDAVQGRGDRPVWALYLQVLRELAQHAGHADILREQILADPQPDVREDEPGDR
jgi:Protein of unknown function (DUF664)